MGELRVSDMSARVLHVLPHQGGGGETYVDFLERMPGFVHQRAYLSAGRTPLSGLASIPVRWPQIVAGARGADLIHAHGDVAGALAYPLLRVRPGVMTTHGLHMLRRVHGVRHGAAKHTIRAVIRGCRAVICTSRAERDELAPLLRDAERQKLRVIENGIDLPPAIDDWERASVRAELGIAADAVFALFAGQLEARKSPLLAAAAATRVHAAGVPLVLAIAGSGPQEPALWALAGQAIKPLGYRSDLPRLLASADVFVQPSEREGISFALLEAMGHGLAVVATNGPGNPEVVGDSGLLVPAGDEDALVAALMRVSSDLSLRASLQRCARARIKERFSAERFLAATEEVYVHALGGLKAPGRPFAGSPA
jgi:glycosyltransferase involved in cell wall biosynthesis